MYDVGQNLTGWAELEVEAPRGTAIEIFYSEKLAATGRRASDGNALVFGQLQTDYYVARGGGPRNVDAAIQLQGLSVRPALRARPPRRCPRA